MSVLLSSNEGIQRFHLMEWEDQRWLPASIREGVTVYLNFIGNLSRAPYAGFVEALSRAMRATDDTLLVDLCSGSAGPLPTILELLGERGLEVRALLTDLFPDGALVERMQNEDRGRIAYLSEPVDATRVPGTLEGFRIVCNGFHHFDAKHARLVLADAVNNRRGIAVFEGVERRLAAVLVCAAALIAVPLATLFIRPWRWRRALLTFVVPIIPLVAAWDGVVSCLRVYTPREMRALITGIPGAEEYEWTITRERVARSPVGVTWLVGHPKAGSVGSVLAAPS